jgi:hypothetical protein
MRGWREASDDRLMRVEVDTDSTEAPNLKLVWQGA